MSNKFFVVETKYACGAIIVNTDDIVVKAAPIFSWMKGKSLGQIKKWKNLTNIKEISESQVWNTSVDKEKKK